MGGNEGEVVDLRGSVGLVVAPTVTIGVPPLGRVEREIIDAQGTDALVVSPAVSVGVLPLGRFEWESVRTVVNGPVFITIGKRIHVGVNATVAVGRGGTSYEGARIGLRGVVNKLSDVPQQARFVEGSVVPVVSVAVFIGIVPLGGIESEGVRFPNGMGKPSLVTVQTSRVGVRIRITVRINATEPIGGGVASAELTVVTLVPL